MGVLDLLDLSQRHTGSPVTCQHAGGVRKVFGPDLERRFVIPAHAGRRGGPAIRQGMQLLDVLLPSGLHVVEGRRAAARPDVQMRVHERGHDRLPRQVDARRGRSLDLPSPTDGRELPVFDENRRVFNRRRTVADDHASPLVQHRISGLCEHFHRPPNPDIECTDIDRTSSHNEADR